MGVDLKLMPLIGETDWVAHDMIGLERDSELFEDIAGLGERPVPMPVKCYEAVGPEGDPCYGDAETGPYGTRLTWLTAGELVTLKRHPSVRGYWQNRAAWAYLAEMPPDWPIVLYWH